MPRSLSSSPPLSSPLLPSSDSTGTAPLLPLPSSSSTQSSLLSPSPSPHKSLYITHTLSTLNSRIFEFGSALYLSTLYPATLSKISLYLFLRNLSAILSSPLIGYLLDHGQRLKTMRTAVLIQRGAVAGSCGLFWGLGTWKKNSSNLDWDLDLERWEGVVFVGLVVLACFEKGAATLAVVGVERDWVSFFFFFSFFFCSLSIALERRVLGPDSSEVRKEAKKKRNYRLTDCLFTDIGGGCCKWKGRGSSRYVIPLTRPQMIISSS
jgi:hypothetical protein